MMKSITIIIVAIFLSLGASGQQIAQSSPIQEIQHIWNPAFTAPGTLLDFSVFYRRQWIGFEGAPSTAVASVQYPFVDMNMSAGGLIISDRTGQISKTGVQLNYAYKLKEILNRDDQLVLAIDGYFHQYQFDSDRAFTTIEGDPLVGSNRQTRFLPSFGAGFAYFSNTEEYNGDNIFYLGFSTLQLLSTDVLIQAGNAQRDRHYFANVGTKLFGYNHYIEPSLQVNFVDPQLINYTLGAKFEMEEAFWARLSYSSVNSVAVDGGVILNDIGGRYTQLRIGALASINGGSLVTAGPSFEFFASYTLDLD